MTDNYAALLRQTAKAYRESLAAPDTDEMFTLAYQWQDKKHRHVWDLCKELERAADRIEKLEEENGVLFAANVRLNSRADLDCDHYRDRIEKLEAEVVRLVRSRNKWGQLYNKTLAKLRLAVWSDSEYVKIIDEKCAEQTDRIEKLETALQKVLARCSWYEIALYNDVEEIIRKALEGKDD